MSIVVKNSELDSKTIETLNNFIDMDMDAGMAFRVSRIMKELSSIIDDKTKAEKRIIEKWSLKDENGNLLPVKNELGEVIPDTVNITDIQSFQKDMNDLMEVNNELSYDRIKFEDLKLSTAKVSDIMKISFLFE